MIGIYNYLIKIPKNSMTESSESKIISMLRVMSSYGNDIKSLTLLARKMNDRPVGISGKGTKMKD